MFLSEASDGGFESHCSHLPFRYHSCSEQGVPWYSDNVRVYPNSKCVCGMTKTQRHWFKYWYTNKRGYRSAMTLSDEFNKPWRTTLFKN